MNSGESALLGQHKVKLGEKNRLALPKKFREALGGKIIVTYGFEGSLIVVRDNNWKALLQGTEDKPFLISGARDTQRFLLGGASVLELDMQGRFVMPEYLRSFAGIKDNAIFLGLNKYVEIWDEAHWNDHREKIQKNISKIAESLIGKIDEG